MSDEMKTCFIKYTTHTRMDGVSIKNGDNVLIKGINIENERRKPMMGVIIASVITIALLIMWRFI